MTAYLQNNEKASPFSRGTSLLNDRETPMRASIHGCTRMTTSQHSLYIVIVANWYVSVYKYVPGMVLIPFFIDDNVPR